MRGWSVIEAQGLCSIALCVVTAEQRVNGSEEIAESSPGLSASVGAVSALITPVFICLGKNYVSDVN